MLIELLIEIVLILAAIFITVSPGVLLFIIIRQLYIWQKKKAETPQKRDQEYMDPGPYGTGWTWNEETKLWEPPKKQEPQIRIYRPEPTFEEWKSAKEAENKPTTYRMVGSEIPKDDTIIYSKTIETTQEKPSTYRMKGSDIPKDDTVIYTRSVKVTRKKTKSETEAKATPKQEPRAEPRPETKPVQKPTPNERTAEFQNAYQAANILTANERSNYKTLKIAADRKGYIICPKVRLADIITPRHDAQYMSRFGKIKSKHVDFVIYDAQMQNIRVVIELDDSSHDRKDRQERDEFVDFILNDCGIRIIHTRYITPDILDGI